MRIVLNTTIGSLDQGFIVCFAGKDIDCMKITYDGSGIGPSTDRG